MEAAFQAQPLHAGPIEIHPDEFLALVDDRPLNLTARELDLLTALVLRQGRIVSREELYAAVWDEPYRKSDRSVDVYVAKLRHKLDQALPDTRLIHTHFGFGYRLEQEGVVDGDDESRPPLGNRSSRDSSSPSTAAGPSPSLQTELVDQQLSEADADTRVERFPSGAGVSASAPPAPAQPSSHRFHIPETTP